MTEDEQRTVCRRFAAHFCAAPDELMLGFSRNFSPTTFPLNGLRHPPEEGTCGWYIWSGETLSQDEDFFLPLHVSHLTERCPSLVKYLGLAPGWRFLIAPDYEDVWWDAKLLDV